MRLTWFSLVSDRRPMLAGLLALTVVFGAASLSSAQAAQQPQQPAAAQEQQPAKPTLAFQNDAGLLLFYIKPDKTADFEDLMTKFKEGLSKLDAPEAKQQAAGLKLFKAPANATAAVYVLVADPVVKNVEYWFLSILYKTFPAEGQALFQKYTDAKADIKPNPTVFDLTVVSKMQ